MADDKTEEATPHRLLEARKKGQVAKSQELISGLALAAAMGTGMILVRTVVVQAQHLLAWTAEHPLDFDSNWSQSAHQMAFLALPLAGDAVLIGLAGGIVATTVGLAQTGMNIVAWAPQFNRINPMEGVKRLISARGLAEIVRVLIKAVVLVWVGVSAIQSTLPAVPRVVDLPVWSTFDLAYTLGCKVLWKMILAYLVLAAADMFYQQQQFKKTMKMTRQEVVDEYRAMEGDPQSRARRNKARRRLAKSIRMDLRKARVVVTNPTHFAVAIAYSGEAWEVPRVVAKGADARAFRLVTLARRQGLLVLESPPLARALYATVKVGAAIPQSLYKATAEILVTVGRLENEMVRKGKTS